MVFMAAKFVTEIATTQNDVNDKECNRQTNTLRKNNNNTEQML